MSVVRATDLMRGVGPASGRLLERVGRKAGLHALLLGLFAWPALAADLPPLTHGLTAVPPGRPAPVLRLADLDGRVHDLAALKGRAVVVNFWATWCPPCRREMPSLERLRRAVPEVAVMAVDVGEDMDTVFAFTGTLEPAPEFPILLDQDSAAMQAWRVKGLPSTFVIGPDGNLAYKAVGGREFDHPEVLAQLRRLVGR